MQEKDHLDNDTIKGALTESKASQGIETTQKDPDETGSTRRIAKNAVMLYLRMFLTMIVGLYTSRVVLNTLGVEDYGIYGVVGGVVAMLGFLNASMSGATSRFLTFELGRGDKKRLADTFSSALIVHIGIALIVFVLAETVGLWFLTHKLVIPEGRMTAAHWVYQLSILSAMLGITQVPYNATIIAHEKMDVYAYVEILNVTLKLLIVYLLTIGNFDKLILYAVLVFAVSVLIMMVYRIYCIRHFSESHFHWTWDKTILKPLLVFSSWNVYGSMCVTIRQQGTNFLINIFFGVVFNAASSIATMLQGVVKGFTFNSTMAFRPQIVKTYAVKEVDTMLQLMKSAMSIAMVMALLISIPVYVEIKYLMDFWLVNTPVMAIEFVRLLLVSAFVAMMTMIFTIGIEATGRNRQVNVYTGTIYALTIPVMYVFFRMGYSVLYSYYCIIGANVLIFISNMLIFKYLVPLVNLWDYLWLFLKSALVIAIVLIPVFFINVALDRGFLRLAVNTLIIVSLLFVLSYFFILDKSARQYIKGKLVILLRIRS